MAMVLVFFAKVDMTNGGHDDSCRPAEHDDPVGRLEGGEETPAFMENDVAVSQRGEGDHRIVKCPLEALNRVQCQIGGCPQKHLHQRDKEHQEDYFAN